MLIHVEVHYSPAAGVAELVDQKDLTSFSDALAFINSTLYEQLNHSKEEDEFTANLFVVDRGDS